MTDQSKLLSDAAAILRRWRMRESTLGLRDNDPDPRLFGETGWLCTELEKAAESSQRRGGEHV